MDATKGNRLPHRDATMILMAYRHGLRAAELVSLEWSQVDFFGAVLAVRRVKRGIPATHPIRGDEIRALRRLQRESPGGPFLFVSERGAPFSHPPASQSSWRGLARPLGCRSRHTRMLRHACGYALANAGHDTRALQAYLGHRSIQHDRQRDGNRASPAERRPKAPPVRLQSIGTQRVRRLEAIGAPARRLGYQAA
jgi:type 1 fimbriae regulatory protein FimB/type 1 fimbriae regulatory protein FimE